MSQSSLQGTTPIDIDDMLANPGNYFADPRDVLASRLSRGFQLKLLHQWEHDAQLLAEAETEGMGGGEESMLHRVSKALLAFEERAASEMAQAADDVARARSPDIRGMIRARPLAAALVMLSLGFLLGRR
jgi:hypothetical protein